MRQVGDGRRLCTLADTPPRTEASSAGRFGATKRVSAQCASGALRSPHLLQHVTPESRVLKIQAIKYVDDHNGDH